MGKEKHQELILFLLFERGLGYTHQSNNLLKLITALSVNLGEQ